jgi:hypothetical protein
VTTCAEDIKNSVYNLADILCAWTPARFSSGQKRRQDVPFSISQISRIESPNHASQVVKTLTKYPFSDNLYSNFPLIIRGSHNDETSLSHFVP